MAENFNKNIAECFKYLFETKKKKRKSTFLIKAIEKELPPNYLFHYPHSIVWQVTSACNLRCKHCIYHGRQEKFDSSNDFNKTEILELAKFFVEEINIISFILTGGEIFLFQDILELVKYLKDNNLNVSISFTVNSLNVNEMPDLIDLCKNLGVDAILTGKFSMFGESQRYLEPCLDDVIKNTAELIKKAAKSFKIEIRHLKASDFLNYEFGKQLLDDYIKFKKPINITNLSCHRHDKFTLSANGKIYLCPNAEVEEFCLGNLRTKTFFEIWENRFQNSLFKKRTKIEMPVCKDCKYIMLCRNACMMESYYGNGDINAPDRNCNYYKTLIKN